MGIIIAGIVGALVAVPILAFVKTFIQELYRQSQEVVPPAAPTPPAAEPVPDTAAA
jgi:predicted PurR-regulated permease PerM